jgi:phospholipid/cholesterol/gamma-HCH transport system substrate-binding protein
VNDINAGKGTLGKVIKDDKLYASVDSAVSNMNVLLKDIKARPYRYIRINVLGSKKLKNARRKI